MVMMICRASVAWAWCRHVGVSQVERDTDKEGHWTKQKKNCRVIYLKYFYQNKEEEKSHRIIYLVWSINFSFYNGMCWSPNIRKIAKKYISSDQ